MLKNPTPPWEQESREVVEVIAPAPDPQDPDKSRGVTPSAAATASPPQELGAFLDSSGPALATDPLK